MFFSNRDVLKVRLLGSLLTGSLILSSPALAQTAGEEEENPDGLWHAYTHYAPGYDECDAQLVGKLSHSAAKADDAGMELIISKVQNGTADQIPALLRQSRARGNTCVFDGEELGTDAAATKSPSSNQSESNERPGVMVDFLYRQQHEPPYSTEWHARVEKKEGDFRTVYYEGFGLIAQTGNLKYFCSNANLPNEKVSVIVEDTTGDVSGKIYEAAIYEIHPTQFGAWAAKNDSNQSLPMLPYEFFVIAKSKYC
ncbi:hypothetical protein A8B75_19345 [Sphingomonadales bacterium EhC05]|nr:hypothetical protein A8B75_19345 [Sphingomonadales bacterium EhC05]